MSMCVFYLFLLLTIIPGKNIDNVSTADSNFDELRHSLFVNINLAILRFYNIHCNRKEPYQNDISLATVLRRVLGQVWFRFKENSETL